MDEIDFSWILHFIMTLSRIDIVTKGFDSVFASPLSLPKKSRFETTVDEIPLKEANEVI